MENGAGNNESCSVEEGQISDFDKRNISNHGVSGDIKASCDSIVEEYAKFYGELALNKLFRGSSCKLSEDDSMDCSSDSSEWCWSFFGEGMF